ncbi:hypothetical protein J4471_02025 [Candidatus Woesearchaeota archaeon]|nr:hypothetical protein [Candidatus Woesearchaeota archaeon]
MDEKEFIEGLKKIVWPSNLGYHDLLNIISADIKNKFVPIEIFAVDNLNPLEAVIKYLKENRKLKYSQIADLLERDDRVIWNTYNKIKIKISLSDKSTLLIPINTFQNKKLSILESLIIHLKNNLRFNFTEIAFKLSRDPRNIWKVYNNGMKKINEKY